MSLTKDNTPSVAPSSEHGDIREHPRMRIGHPPPFVTEVKPNDILMGRGAPAVQHVGNNRLREELVAPHKREYASTNRQQGKCDIARKIVNGVKERGGRFLYKIKSSVYAMHFRVLEGTETYTIAIDDAAIEKVKQTLRSKDQQNEQEVLPTRLSRCSAVREDLNLLQFQDGDVFSHETSHHAVPSTTNPTTALLKESRARQQITLAMQHREEKKLSTAQQQMQSTNQAQGQLENLYRSRSCMAMNLPRNISISQLQNGSIHREAALLQRPSQNRGTTRPREVVDPRSEQVGDPLSVHTTLANQAAMRDPPGTVDEEQNIRAPTSSCKKLKRHKE